MPTIEREIQDILDSLISTYNYVVFFTNYDTPTNTDTIGSKSELGRIAITGVRTGNYFNCEYTAGVDDLVCPETTIIAVTDSLNFEVNDPSGFATNDRIYIESSAGFVDRKVTVSGSDFTIDRPIPGTLTTSIPVKLRISQRAVVKNGAAGANTGELVHIEKYIRSKSDTQIINGNCKIKLIG